MSIQKVDKTTGDTSLICGSTNFSDNPIGAILPYGGATAPSGWFLCQGQAVSRITYSELFAVIGTAFGAGDGSTTFNLPDMRESVPKGAGLTGKTVGAHVSTNGLAVGEFLDDRLQEHQHKYWSTYNGDVDNSYGIGKGSTPYTIDMTGRKGDTTEVKAVGVNYIIKAKMVAMPSDFMSKVDEAVEEMCTDTVTSGSTAPITSGGVYNAVCNYVQINSMADVRALTDNRWYMLSVNTEFTVGGKTVPKLSTAFMYKSTVDTVVSFHAAYPTYGAKIVDVFMNTDGTYNAYEYTPTS